MLCANNWKEYNNHKRKLRVTVNREEGETPTGQQLDGDGAVEMASNQGQDSSSLRRSMLNQQLATYWDQKLKQNFPVD